MSDTAQRVKKVTSELLKVDINEVKPESDFIKDLGAESIQSIELVAAFEEEFDLEMDEEAALLVKNVGDAITFIDKVRAEQS